MKDLHNDINIVQVLKPDAIDNDIPRVGTVVDNKDYDAVEYVINIGTLADLGAIFTVLLEDSNDNSTYAAVADTFLLGTMQLLQFQFNNNDEVRRIGYNGSKRYTRMTITPTNNSDSAAFGVVAIQGAPIHAPVANN